MKNLIFSSILLCLLVSCNNSRTNDTSSIKSTKISDDAPNIWEEIDKKTAWFKKGSNVYSSLDSIDSAFIEFYLKFITDHRYQLEHIQFPILGAIGECDTTIVLNASNWEDYTYDFRKDFYVSEDNIVMAQSDSRFYFEKYREEIGLLFSIGFEKRNGQWYLTLYNVNVC